MSLRIENSQQALNAQRQLSGSQSKENASMEHPAAGKGINTRTADRVSLSTSSLFGGDVSALNRSMKSVSDGISMAKVCGAALSDISGMLEKMSELAARKGNGAFGLEDMAAIDADIASLQAEVNNVRSDTRFNDQSRLDGLSATFDVGETDTYTMSVGTVNVDVGGTVPDLQAAIDNVRKARAEFDAAAEELWARSTASARYRFGDADAASEVAEPIEGSIPQNMGAAVDSQVGQGTDVASSLPDG